MIPPPVAVPTGDLGGDQHLVWGRAEMAAAEQAERRHVSTDHLTVSGHRHDVSPGARFPGNGT